MAQLQGFFVVHRKNPSLILKNISQLLQSEENTLIDGWLKEIKCPEAISHFKLRGYSMMTSVKSLPNETIEAILTSKLSKDQISVIIQSIRS